MISAMALSGRVQSSVLTQLCTESRAIEGLSPSDASVTVLRAFLSTPLTLDSVKAYCYAEAGTVVRARAGMDVRVGRYICPPGGPAIPTELETIVNDAAQQSWPSWNTHARFLNLHPFMDGNGRTARAIYIHQGMQSQHGFQWLASRPLLQSLYYSALSDNDARIASMQ